MRQRLLLVMAALAWLVSAQAADNMLKNGALARAAAGNAAAPADWSLPDRGPWALEAGAGPAGVPALRYSGDGLPVAAVRDACDFIPPTAVCLLKFQYRTEGPLSPLVRVMDLGRQQELGRLALTPSNAWREASLEFRTGTADAGLELYADQAHLANQAAKAGRVWFAALSVTVTAGPDTGAAPVPDLGENLALGKPYTMPPPNYSLCADPDDGKQLTDGVFTEGHFWTRKTTVGWSGSNSTLVTIDLGRDYPIKGLLYSTAAGVAGVTWPKAVRVYCSSDKQSWWEAGDVVRLYKLHSQFPPDGVYAARKVWTDQLATHGRYVALCLEPSGAYTFCDEIAVYRGDDSLLQKTAKVAWQGDLASFLKQRQTDALIADQYRRDLEAVKADIEQLPLYKISGPRLKAAMLTEAIDQMPSQSMEGFRAVLPMSDLERDIFKLQAAVWREQGKPELRVWTKQRWDMLEPAEEPADKAAPRLDVHMMNNETRAAVFNLTNGAPRDQRLRLRLTGLPGGMSPDYIRVQEVLNVGTRRFVAVAAALPDARREGAEYVVTVPEGMTRQIWLSFHPDGLKAGTYAGKVEVLAAARTVATMPLNLTIYPLRFPQETTLLVGGWEYTDAEATYGITAENRDKVIAYLKQFHVNAPWASGSALPWGKLNSAGQITEKPDTSRFDNWVRLWPEAKMYMVFLAVGDTAGGCKRGTPEFSVAIGEWARFWAAHLKDLGLKPSQLGLLIYDEPSRKEQYDLITAWARAINAAVPEFVCWEDPQPTEAQDCLEMFSAVDALCPYRNPFLAQADWYRELFLQKQREGKDLWFYNADGPARSFDPYSFYLLQEWHAFKIGAKGSNFWAFGDNGGVSCWNEYPAQGNGPYCPMYLDGTSVTSGKWMEAIREGIEDYEYLTMLRKRVVALEQQGVLAARLAKAKELLATGPDRVMAMEKGANYRWDEKKDRGTQDVVRIEVLKTLTELQ